LRYSDADSGSHSAAEGSYCRSAADKEDVAGTNYVEEVAMIPLARRIPLLIALLKTSALASVVSRYLSLKPLPFGIHLLALVIHHNRAIH
jgi:hypothetical protein